MYHRFTVLASCGAVCLASLALLTRAEEPKPAEAPPPSTPPAPSVPAPSAPDMAAMQKAWEDAATPGEEHRKMAEMVGEWTASVEDFTSGAPMTSEASAKFTVILGGRYLQQEFHGTMGGMEFDGLGITGYNNMTRKFQEVWLDSGGTAVYFAQGSRIDEHSTETKGKMTMPGVGEVDSRSVAKHIDKDHMTFEMYGPNPMDGKESMWIKISYTRKM